MSYEGVLDQISFGIEGGVGTPVTPTVSLPILPSSGITVVQEAVGVPGIDTNPAANKDFHQGKREYSGGFECNAYPLSLGYLILSALGAVGTDAVASETLVKKHTFSESVTKTSLTLEQKIDDMVRRFAGFTLSKLGLSATVGEALKVSFEGLALSEATETAITPAYETSKVFDWTDVYSITVNGTDIKGDVESFELEYTNGLQYFHGMASQPDPTRHYATTSEARGKITATLTNDIRALRETLKNCTTVPVVITLIADETIGNGSNNKLVITLPKCAITTFTNPIDTTYAQAEFEFVGANDAASGLITMELTNLQIGF